MARSVQHAVVRGLGLLLAGLSLAPCSEGQAPAAAPSAQAPKIVFKDGKDTLQLPPKLAETIKTRYPGFRVPGPGDVKGPWQAEGRRGSLPFAAWGDFDGDGDTDVALALFSDTEWKFVIFNAKDGAYEPAYVAGANMTDADASVKQPQEIFVRRIPKGQVTTITSGDKPLKYSFPQDAVELVVYEKELYLIHWDKGKYVEISFVD